MATREEIREAALLLGLDEGMQLDMKALRSAYTKFAHEWHPDVATKNGVSAEGANAKMAAGNKAFAMLKKAIEDEGGAILIPTEQQARPDPTPAPEPQEYQGPRPEAHEWRYDPDEPNPDVSDGAASAHEHRSEWHEAFEDIVQPVNQTPFWTASVPAKTLRIINLLIEAFFIYLVIESFKSHPVLTPLMFPFLFGITWLYRMVARIVLEIADAFSSVALVLDVAIVAFIWWRYGTLLSAIFGPFFQSLG